MSAEAMARLTNARTVDSTARAGGRRRRGRRITGTSFMNNSVADGGMAERDAIDLSDGKCPDCGCKSFHPGPRGGAAINVMCAQCGSCFNYCGPLPAQRIACVDGVYSTHAGPLDRASTALVLFNTLATLQSERDECAARVELMRRVLLQIASHEACPNDIRLIAHEAAGLAK